MSILIQHAAVSPDSRERQDSRFRPLDPPRSGAALGDAPVATECAALQIAVDDMIRALADDVSNGVVGTRSNTYPHRSRVLHQQTARLAALRLTPAPAAGAITPPS